MAILVDNAFVAIARATNDKIIRPRKTNEVRGIPSFTFLAAVYTMLQHNALWQRPLRDVTRTLRLDRRTTDTHDTDSTSAYDLYFRLTTITRLDNTDRPPTTSDYGFNLRATTWRTLRSTTERVSDTLRTITIAVRERHYSRDCLVLRFSRLRVLPVYVHYSFVVYTCLQSTSPSALPAPLRFTFATSP